MSNGIHPLNNPTLVAHIHDKKRLDEQADKEKATKDRNRLKYLISKVAQTRTKRGRGEDDAFAKWTTTELLTYLQYKKLPEDGSMPKKFLTKVTCVEPSWKENPQFFLHTRLIIEETTLMMMKEIRLVMEEKEKLFPMKEKKRTMQNSIS